MLVLASGSEIRRQLLEAAHVPFDVVTARVDEDAVKQALLAEGVGPRDIADALAEAKARKGAGKRPGDLVLGCDQTCDLDGALLDKPRDPDEAVARLRMLSGRRHKLHTAVVAIDDTGPIWRHVETTRMTMRPLSDAYIDAFVARNWPAIGTSSGGYRIEDEGMRLFAEIEGSHFSVLGLPMLPLLSWLSLAGYLET